MLLTKNKSKKFWSPMLFPVYSGNATTGITLTFLGNTANQSAGFTTSGSVTCPGSAPQLYIVACVARTAATWSAVTLGGNALTQILNPGNGTAIFAGTIAVTGVQTLSGTASANNFNNKWLSIWSVNGLSSTTVKQTANWTTGTSTISVTANDIMIAAGTTNGSGTPAWTLSTQSPTSTQFNGTGDMGTAHWSSITSTNASFSLAPTVAGNGQQGESVATWS